MTLQRLEQIGWVVPSHADDQARTRRCDLRKTVSNRGPVWPWRTHLCSDRVDGRLEQRAIVWGQSHFFDYTRGVPQYDSKLNQLRSACHARTRCRSRRCGPTSTVLEHRCRSSTAAFFGSQLWRATPRRQPTRRRPGDRRLVPSHRGASTADRVNPDVVARFRIERFRQWIDALRSVRARRRRTRLMRTRQPVAGSSSSTHECSTWRDP